MMRSRLVRAAQLGKLVSSTLVPRLQSRHQAWGMLASSMAWLAMFIPGSRLSIHLKRWRSSSQSGGSPGRRT